MKRVVVLLIMILIVIGFIFGEDSDRAKRRQEWREKIMKKYPLPENNQQLKRIRSFPDEDQIEQDIYMKNPFSLVGDKDGTIYAVDQAGHKILVFDGDGKYLKQIGQSGQGPADLFRPSSIALWNDQIVVSETGNMRIQFLDKNGKYIKSFRTFKAYISIALDDEGLIYGVPAVSRGNTIVDVLNQDGKLLRSFGEWKQPADIMFKIQLFVLKKYIYIGRTMGGIIEKYTKKGELVETIRINYPIITDKAKEATNQNANSRQTKKSITDFFIFEDSIFVSFYFPRFEIIELTMKGEVKKVFWTTEFNRYLHFDFIVHQLKGKLVFYVARVLPDQQIDKFSY